MTLPERRIVAVLAALAAAVGVFAIPRPRADVPDPAARPVTPPTRRAIAEDAKDPSTDEGSASASRRLARGLSDPDADRQAIPGPDTTVPAAPPSAGPPAEAGRAAPAYRGEPTDVGRSETAAARSEAATGEDRPTSVPTRPVSAVAPNEEAVVRDGWEAPIDPAGDSKIHIDPTEDRIDIDVPASPRVLSAELGRMDAPRMLRPARGDFDVSVSVNGVFDPSDRTTMREYAPYHGAGILLWQDGRDYVRLEIAADFHRGKPRPYVNFELRKDGALAVSRGIRIADGSNRLLLQRRGAEVRAAFSPDGIRWTWFVPMTVEFEDDLKVGVVAINTATRPLYAELEGFAIAKPGSDRAGP